MNHYRMENIEVGHKESFVTTIGELKMKCFLDITGDLNPLHNDETFAKNKGFNGRVVYGLLNASFFSTLAGMYLPGERCLIQEVLIRDDFSLPEAGGGVIHEISKNGIWPDHMVLLSSPKVENIRFRKSTWENFEKYLHVSLKSAINISREVLKHLDKDEREGRIIFMLSSCVNGVPPKYLSSYVTAKYAMLGLMKALATEYDSKNITVNGVSPGMMETKFLSEMYDHAIEENALKSPFGRNLHVDEVIPAFEYLLSDGASKVTGQNIVVTGGI